MDLLKRKYVCTEEKYDSIRSSFLYFLFPNEKVSEIENRLTQSHVFHQKMDDQHLFCIDGFFSPSEAKILSNYSKATSFSDISYGSLESAALGENPSMTFDAQERWKFFLQPPQPISLFYDFLSYLSCELEVEISTMPWMLFDGVAGSCAVIANKVSHVKNESTLKGKHKDVDPTKKLSFEVPCLYEKKSHIGLHKNGSLGSPYYLTVMLYSIAEGFKEEYHMGTSFFSKDGTMTHCLCKDMRIVIFEGDMVHSIGASNFSQEIDTWRVSYVFKVVLNPKKANQNIPIDLMNFFSNSSISSFTSTSEHFF